MSEGGSQMEIQMINVFNVNQVELKNLDPSSYYLFKVIARTAAGQGPPITRRGATLLEGGKRTAIKPQLQPTIINHKLIHSDALDYYGAPFDSKINICYPAKHLIYKLNI